MNLNNESFNTDINLIKFAGNHKKIIVSKDYMIIMYVSHVLNRDKCN